MFHIAPILPKFEAQPSEVFTPYAIEDFTGGLNTNDPESALRDDQFTTMLNWLMTDNRRIKIRGPFRPWLVASENTVVPDSVAALTLICVELRGSDFRVISWDNGSNYEVSVYDESNNRWAGNGGGTSIKTNLTDGYKVRFAKFSVNEAEDLLFCNGKDTPQRWVGTVDNASSDLGLAVPSLGAGKTATEDNTLAGEDRGITVSGVYTYKFTYFYDDSGTSTKYGESGPSAVLTSADLSNASSTNPVGGSLDLDLTGSALPSGVTKCNVYRSPPDQSVGPFRYVGYFASGDTYTDNCPNGEEGDEPDTDAGTPPKLKNPLVYDGRLWGIGISATGTLTNKGVYSRKNSPDFFPAENFYYFADPLVGPALFNRNVYWFTEKQVWVTIGGDVESDPIKVCDIGCDAFDSIVDVGNGLVWQYQGNIYWANFNDYNPLTGDLPWPIGEPISNKIDAIASGYESNSSATLYKDRYYLSYTGPNQTVNTATLVWDVKHGTRLLQQGLTGAWSMVDWAANDLQTFNGTLYTLDNTNKYIMEHDFAGGADYHTKTEYDAGTDHDLACQLTTGILHFGHEWTEKIVNSLSLIIHGSGITLNTTLSFNADEFERITSFTLGSASVATDSTWLVWGQGTWNNFNWGGVNEGFQSDHQKINKGGKGRNCQLDLQSTNAQDTKLIAVKLYYKELPTPA
jgi:hypothetical protein